MKTFFDSGLETKFCRAEAKLTVTERREITGYASLFGAVDQGGDIVERGAYASSLRGGRGVKMLWQHDPREPIGIWDEVREDAAGLFVKGRLLDGVARAREAAALIEAGAIDGLSIGYRTVRAHRNDKGQRLLTEVDLWEVSLVTFPMLPEARLAPTRPETAKQDDLQDLAAAFHDARRRLAARSAR
ncbi:HK97 family phage prohead protease [Roseibacterium sp. SDUM158017]|uniref:HK97 family phage prohead protease n=1 Tax=Roseicyclus salinarum TaxID=3036773 RepID=UPI002414E7F4|nr:HK97 family phage prohead protease [Roseibacterium sp. SDUM158017]MDG4649799.1 HK97 family phage prohead protease [Roseibacterium sp. SDUM158017]